jgi:capsular polysaccharide export protein
MVSLGLESFKNKNVIFLQGPVGPFFQNLMQDFLDVGAIVHKINFNGGDSYFSSNHAVNYRGSLEEWPDYFTQFIDTWKIDTVILFGDCRNYHRIAHTIADAKGLNIGVFEEGYVRPDYITFEEFGVNGNSQLPRNRNFYDQLMKDNFKIPFTLQVGNTFWATAWWAIVYYFFSALLYPVFSQYRHHRPLNPFEGIFWIRSMYRKWIYRLFERGIFPSLILNHSKNYFLAPLQISTDAQIREHSDFDSVEAFIDRIISSFSTNAPEKLLLVIKHHPLDRGYHDYSELIHRLSKAYNVSERVIYIHDQHLPTLLEHARGVVLINSTVGLSAIHHGTALKTCGSAIYDIDGLTYQGKLENFWCDSENFTLDKDLYQRFKGYVINNKQINGNFYHRLKESKLKSGVLW